MGDDMWKEIFGNRDKDMSRLRNAAVYCSDCQRHVTDAAGTNEHVILYMGMCWDCFKRWGAAHNTRA